LTTTPAVPAGILAERLVRQIGGPTTKGRLEQALSTLLARSDASLAEVKQAALSGHGPRADSMGSLQTFLRELEAGEILNAAEGCKAMETDGHPGVALARRALHAYFPRNIAFSGGLGASPWTPIVIGNPRTIDEHVAACSAYIDCVLGPSRYGWSISKCDALVVRDGIQDGIVLKGPSGESVALFFYVQSLEGLEVPGISVMGTLEMAGRSKPSIRLNQDVVREVAPYVKRHLTCHAECHQIRSDARGSRHLGGQG
jgi:hypothetical protein